MERRQDYLSNYYNPIYSGLIALAEEGEQTATILLEKLQQMENVYLRSINDYADTERKKIRYYREAFSYKFYLANLHIEQLWSINHSIKTPALLQTVLENIFDIHDLLDGELLLLCLCFEGFIIQSSAFLDFYMLYMCSIFKIQDTKRLSGRKFKQSLSKVIGKPFGEKAKAVECYFSNNIFGDNAGEKLLSKNWGELVKNLRNSLVHRDSLYPDFCNDISLLQKIITWPENELDLSVSRFCQDIQNDIFYLVTDLATTVYGLEYKPGPYKDGMWS